MIQELLTPGDSFVLEAWHAMMPLSAVAGAVAAWMAIRRSKNGSGSVDGKLDLLHRDVMGLSISVKRAEERQDKHFDRLYDALRDHDRRITRVEERTAG